jgi:hypothetical protein
MTINDLRAMAAPLRKAGGGALHDTAARVITAVVLAPAVWPRHRTARRHSCALNDPCPAQGFPQARFYLQAPPTLQKCFETGARAVIFAAEERVLMALTLAGAACVALADSLRHSTEQPPNPPMRFAAVSRALRRL